MRISAISLALALGVATLGAACSDKQAASSSSSAAATPTPQATTAAAGQAPDSFHVVFETSRGPFTVLINRAWAPKGADRFHELVEQGFFTDEKFFRVVPGFVAQFGLSGDPKHNESWDGKRLMDDSVKQSNVRYTLTFATQGPNTRTHQLFLNLADNQKLDGMGFAPIGKVVAGMSVVDSLYSEYGEAPDQQFIQTLGNSYLDRTFPKLDYIKSAKITP